MKPARITCNIDEETKDAANAILNRLGLDMTTAINVYLRKIIAVNGLPFDLTLKPNAETLAAMRESEQIAYDPNVKGYKSIEEFMRSLEE